MSQGAQAYQVERWTHAQPPTRDEIEANLRQDGLSAYIWSNGPDYAYAPHRHGYDKVIYVIEGSIRFGLPELGEQIELKPGDRLELPSGVLHDARVGPDGVVCLEAQR